MSRSLGACTLSNENDAVHRLAAWLGGLSRLFVLTGAGCSTASGIPDYRAADGSWKRRPPVTYQAFVGDLAARQRYWARSMVGWPRVDTATPNAAHMAIAEMQRRGTVSLLVTQNVDGLHDKAGSTGIVDLHGRIDSVLCLDCGHTEPRTNVQSWLLDRNPAWRGLSAAAAPDGDADIDDVDTSTFVVPPCPRCGGMIKPDVVFFGENVPRLRVDRAFEALESSDGLLVVGSSLMVYSGFRFARVAHERGCPIALLTRGATRADALASLKVEDDCVRVLPPAVAMAAGRAAGRSGASQCLT